MVFRRLVLGDPPAPRNQLVGRFVLLVVVVWVVTELLGQLLPGSSLEALFASIIVPVVFFYLPGIVAAVGGYLEYGALACLALGLVPGIFIGSVVALEIMLGIADSGDASVVGIVLAFTSTGVFFALGGFLVGIGVRYFRYGWPDVSDEHP